MSAVVCVDGFDVNTVVQQNASCPASRFQLWCSFLWRLRFRGGGAHPLLLITRQVGSAQQGVDRRARHPGQRRRGDDGHVAPRLPQVAALAAAPPLPLHLRAAIAPGAGLRLRRRRLTPLFKNAGPSELFPWGHDTVHSSTAGPPWLNGTAPRGGARKPPPAAPPRPP